MKTLIEVEITNIRVDDRYYAFDYVITVNGKKGKKAEYESDYENGLSPIGQKKMLENGEAVRLALENFDPQ